MKSHHSAQFLFFLIIGFAILFTITSCSGLVNTNVQQELKKDILYKKDMIVNNQEGLILLPLDELVPMNVESRGSLDMFIMRTCNKEVTKEKAWNVKQTIKTGLFGWGSRSIDVKDQVNFTYSPNDLEKQPGCYMELSGLDSISQQNSWAIVVFTHEAFKQLATLSCNGINAVFQGTSVCQTRQGLIEQISFPEEVTALSNSCGIEQKSAKVFQWTMLKDKCIVTFKNRSSGQLHRLFMFGYEDIIVRSLNK